MASKKGMVMSTLIGLVIVGLIVGFVLVPLFAGILSLLIPRADYASVQGFERVWDAMQKAQEGKTTYVPFDLKSGYKITTNQFDSICNKKCICLCMGDTSVKTQSGAFQPKLGCSIKIFKEHCSSKNINLHGEIAIPGQFPSNQVGVLTINRGPTQFDISGTYTGKCIFKDYSQCMSAGDCFAGFVTSKIDLQVTKNFNCAVCGDELKSGQYAAPKTVNCERYSYHIISEARSTGVNPTSSVNYEFTIPTDHPEYSNAKLQCETTDPCKLKTKGITCKWEEDSSAKTGTCKTATSAPNTAP